MTVRPKAVRPDIVFLGLLTLAALALRLWTLASRALLPDEGSSYFFSQLPLATLLWSLCDPHPPGYYILLRTVALFGHSEAWLRLPSALAGTFAVPLTWVVARAAIYPTVEPSQRWPAQAALLAAALVAFAPLAVWYSQDARPYASLSLLALVMAWAGLHWQSQPSKTTSAVYLVAGWLALWTEYGALLIWLGLNLFLLSGWPWRVPDSSRAGSYRQWLALQIVLLAPFGLWWLASAQREALTQMSYQAIFLAVQAQGLGLDWTPELAQRFILVAGLAVIGGGLALALAVRRSPTIRRLSSSAVMAAVLVGLIVTLAFLGALPRLYTVKRHLIAMLPFISIAAAWALLRPATGQPNRLRHIVAVATAVALFLLSIAATQFAPRPAWPQLVEALAAHQQPEDVLLVDDHDGPVFAYYWRNRSPWTPLSGLDLEVLTRVSEEQRVWLAGSVSPYRDLRQTLPPEFATQRAAAQNFIWRDAALTAYDAIATPQITSDPPLTLRWGLAIRSPMDILCR